MQTNLKIEHYLTFERVNRASILMVYSTVTGKYPREYREPEPELYNEMGVVLANYLMENFWNEIKAYAEARSYNFQLGAMEKKGNYITINGHLGAERIIGTMQALGLGIARTSVNNNEYIVYRGEPRLLLPYLTDIGYLFNKHPEPELN